MSLSDAELDRYARHIVLRDGRIVMAHPFATIPLGFSVMAFMIAAPLMFAAVGMVPFAIVNM